MLHVRNGAITSKHIFAGTSRIATRVITAEQAPRERELDGSESLGGLTVETVTSVMGTSSPDTETSSAPPGKSTLGNTVKDSTIADSGHPGKGLANRSERANEVARNTEKNPHLTGSHPGQGLENRSDRANERAQNTNKNPHLIGGGDSGDGTPPDTGNPGGGNGGGNSGGGSAGAGADFLYYYHPDHLGSTGYVTDDQGQLYEHVLYFPFGETWVEQASNTWRTPYLYTSKELDPETGLYYFGARYYDPRTSVWQSADPILREYLPLTNNEERGNKLPGMGGVYNSHNLGLFSYSHLNPMKFFDPDGNATIRFAENVPQQERQMVTANVKAVENRVQQQSMGQSRERLQGLFDKWVVNYVGGGPRDLGGGKAVSGNTHGRKNRTTLYMGDQDTVAHEFYHTTPENINAGSSSSPYSLIGRPDLDPTEHGAFGAVDFARDLLSGENVDKYSTGQTVVPLEVQQPRRSLWQYLKDQFSGASGDE